MEQWESDFRVGGPSITNYRITLSKFGHIINTINRNTPNISPEYGLEINHSKRNIMIVDGKNENSSDSKIMGDFDVVINFVLLRSSTSKIGGCDLEIKRRIRRAHGAMS